MSTETPITNAATFDIEVIGDAHTNRIPYTDGSGMYVFSEVARTLELENTRLAGEVERLTRERDEAKQQTTARAFGS